MGALGNWLRRTRSCGLEYLKVDVMVVNWVTVRDFNIVADSWDR